MPISGKEMLAEFLRAGFAIIKSHGGIRRKGGHVKVRKGSETVIIPMHKELKKGTEATLRKKLRDIKK